MKELVILVMYICASISDMRNRTIPNRIPIMLVFLWPIWLAVNKNRAEMIMSSLWSELFVISVLILVSIVIKFMGHMSSIGGGDIKLILSTCLYLEIKETFVFLFLANILGVMFSFLFTIWSNFSKRGHKNNQENTSSNNILMYTFPFAPFLTIGVALALFLR
ncbi:prepilin peptidase [Lancefieldella parvula]|uniref:prepilin peptidase n=1 Tax=Lancefieldella parvula TaxID=1382 RepID=UPI00361623E7